MHSAQVIVTVKQLEPSLREQGIRAIYLFGSVARETQTDSSDIDLAFDLAPGATERFSLIDQLHIQRQWRPLRSNSQPSRPWWYGRSARPPLDCGHRNCPILRSASLREEAHRDNAQPLADRNYQVEFGWLFCLEAEVPGECSPTVFDELFQKAEFSASTGDAYGFRDQ